LRGPLGLAWRLQRGMLAAWTAGFALFGLVFGSISTSLNGFLSSNQAREFFTKLGGEKGVVDMFLAAMLSLLGVAASAYGVQAAMRLHAEETATRAEQVLATGTSRVRWVASHTAVALLGTA